MNALKHGLTAQQVVMPDEDPEDYEALLRQLMSEYDPQSALGKMLVEQLAGAIWRLKRIPRFEPAIIVAHRALSDQADAVFMRNVNKALTRQPVQDVKHHLEDMKERGELDAAECAMLDAIDAHGVAVEAFDTPVSRLGRALVLQGNALQALGTLSRYERELTANLERYMTLLETEQKKRGPTIEASCKEVGPTA